MVGSRGEPRRRHRVVSGFLVVVLLVAIGLTGSRTVLTIGLAVVLLLLSLDVRGRLRAARLVVLGLIGLAVLSVLFLRVPRFSERRGSETAKVGDVDVQTSGRGYMWSRAIESWSESNASLLLGKGVGSLGGLIQTFRPGPHPHNEYLRLLHDVGVVGLGLWLAAIGNLLWLLLSRVLRSPKGFDHRLTALCCLASVLLACVLLNPLVYIFVMAPLAVIVGTGLAPTQL